MNIRVCPGNRCKQVFNTWVKESMMTQISAFPQAFSPAPTSFLSLQRPLKSLSHV